MRRIPNPNPQDPDRLGQLYMAAALVLFLFAFAMLGKLVHGAEETRPVVYVYTVRGCQPCKRLKTDIADGRLSAFRIVYRDPPEWVTTVPVLHFQGADGLWHRFPAHEGGWGPGYADRFIRRWHFWNPNGVL